MMPAKEKGTVKVKETRVIRGSVFTRVLNPETVLTCIKANFVK